MVVCTMMLSLACDDSLVFSSGCSAINKNIRSSCRLAQSSSIEANKHSIVISGRVLETSSHQPFSKNTSYTQRRTLLQSQFQNPILAMGPIDTVELPSNLIHTRLSVPFHDYVCSDADTLRISESVSLKRVEKKEVRNKYEKGISDELLAFTKDATQNDPSASLYSRAPESLKGHFIAMTALVQWSLGESLVQLAKIQGNTGALNNDEVKALHHAIRYLKAATLFMVWFQQRVKASDFPPALNKNDYLIEIDNYVYQLTGIAGSSTESDEFPQKVFSILTDDALTGRLQSEALRESPAFFYSEIIEKIMALNELDLMCAFELENLNLQGPSGAAVSRKQEDKIAFNIDLIRNISLQHLKPELKKVKYQDVLGVDYLEALIGNM